MQIYLVGGAVRDKLLGLPVKERDWVVVGSTPAAMRKLGYRQVGKDFPVFLHPQTGEEYALARTERKTGPGYTGFEFNAAPQVTLQEDLQRRDFTINAIAEDETQQLIDPFNGQADLTNKVIRHISAAFAEDPVRILRGARFASRFGEFSIAPETTALMQQMVNAGEVDALVPERVWQEFARALASDYPWRFIEVLQSCDALAKLFPEIDRLFGVVQKPQWHPEIDTGIHVLMALTQATYLSPDPRVRFAVLMHDVGKGVTPKDILPSHKGHEARGVDLIKNFCQRYRVPNDYRELALINAQYHGLCHQALELRPKTILELLEKTDAFRRGQRFEQFLIACEADAKGRKGFQQQPYPQRKFLQQALQAAQAVAVKPLLEQGLQGEAIARELQQLRIKAIKKLP